MDTSRNLLPVPFIVADATVGSIFEHNKTWRWRQLTSGSSQHTFMVLTGEYVIRLYAIEEDQTEIFVQADLNFDDVLSFAELSAQDFVEGIMRIVTADRLERRNHLQEAQRLFSLGQVQENLPEKHYRNNEDTQAVKRLIAGENEAVIKTEWLTKIRRRKLADPDVRFRQLKMDAEAFKKRS